jgi:uncharacterized membrane protein (DUF485 family)
LQAAKNKTLRQRKLRRGARAPNPPIAKQETSMEDELVARIAAHPQYRQLKRRRDRFGWTLAVLMLIAYYGFVLLVAFDKEFLARRIGDGVMTLGMPIGFGVIVFTVAITGYYVRRANAEFDTLSDAVVKAVQKAAKP